MPLRLLIYMAEIWRDIYQNTEIREWERKGYRVPVIIPAVLYNGVENWTASEEFRDLLSESGRFGSHALNFRYLLFDVNRYQERRRFVQGCQPDRQRIRTGSEEGKRGSSQTSETIGGVD